MSRSGQRQIWLEAERLATQHTDAQGHVDLVAAMQALKAWLDANPTIANDTEQQAAEVIRRLDDTRRPRLANIGGQLSFWSPGAWLPTGREGERVLMEKMIEPEFDAWWEIEQSEHNAQLVAYAEKYKYRRSRKQAWAGDQTLGDVERRVFGWQG